MPVVDRCGWRTPRTSKGTEANVSLGARTRLLTAVVRWKRRTTRTASRCLIFRMAEGCWPISDAQPTEAVSRSVRVRPLPPVRLIASRVPGASVITWCFDPGAEDSIRIIVRRGRPYLGAQLSLFDLDEGMRHQVFLTDTLHGEGCLQHLRVRHRAHARVEDRTRSGKATGFVRFPSRRLRSTPPGWDCP